MNLFMIAGRWLLYMAPVVALSGAIACTFDESGLAGLPVDPIKEFYLCTGGLKDCGKSEKPVTVTVSAAEPKFLINQYVVRDGLAEIVASDPSTHANNRPYVDRPWVITHVELEELKGSVFVQTRFVDANVDSALFLRVHFPSFNDIENIYVAYDARANPKPAWLIRDYEQDRKADGTPYYVRTTIPNNMKGVTASNVPLEIWHLKDAGKIPGVPIGGETIGIPGNSFGKPKWSGVPDNNRAMYFVIIRQKLIEDCNKGQIYNSVAVEGCALSESKALAKARYDCQTKWKNDPKLAPLHLQCTQPVCKKVQFCAQRKGLVQTRSYMHSSEIAFDPAKYKSEAAITIKGSKYSNRKVYGTLHFEYALDDFGGLTEMKINSMILKLDPLKTGIGTFKDITIALLGPVKATCQDANPPYAAPCTHYNIPADKFKPGLTTVKGTKKLLYVAWNKHPVDIQIDHKKRTFTIKGSTTTNMMLEGESTPLNVDIDLFGHFVNFAPHATAVESTKSVGCSTAEDKIAGNHSPVFLDPAGSFEVYKDPIPLSAYKWYEDFGLVTEKFWGPKPQASSPKVVIPPHQLSFGLHHFVLIIRDTHGIADADHVWVEVRDSSPPQLTVPKDVSFLLVPPQRAPVKLNIGEAWAGDSCSNDVMITNDAPEGMLFPAGVTVVTWKADDGMGNIATKTQRVNVYSGPDRPPFEKLQPVPATPDKAAWCDQFSRMSLSHSAENSLRGCAFTGGRWGSDYDAHYQWCMKTPRAAAMEVNDNRQLALQSDCQLAQQPQPWQPPQPVLPPQTEQPPQPADENQARCNRYAGAAVAQNAANLSRGCGFTGPRWLSDHNAHNTWCLKTPKLFADFENAERDKALNQNCRGAQPYPPPQRVPAPPSAPPPPPAALPPAGNQAQCDRYARNAVAQVQRSVSQRCGFSGPRWSADYGAHYQWCLRVPAGASNSEAMARENDLNARCRPPLPRVQ